MAEGLRRRDFIARGLIASAALSAPGRLLAEPTAGVVGTPGLTGFAPSTPIVQPLPEAAPQITPTAEQMAVYRRRVLDIAVREKARAGAKLWRTDLVAVADFAMPSYLPRFHFANLEDGSIRSFLVAHGKGSDREHDGWLKNFSNVPGSEATSRGGYLTCEWYTGKYGTSIRLVGLDPDNSTALDRLIVVHPAKYVDSSMISKWGKIGRSEGCFAMAPADFNEALWRLSGGRLLFADRIGLS